MAGFAISAHTQQINHHASALPAIQSRKSDSNSAESRPSFAPSGADHTLERLAAAVGRVEFSAVFQPSAVLGGDQRAFDGGFAIAWLKVDDLQFVIHASYSFTVARVLRARTEVFAESALNGNRWGSKVFRFAPEEIKDRSLVSLDSSYKGYRVPVGAVE